MARDAIASPSVPQTKISESGRKGEPSPRGAKWDGSRRGQNWALEIRYTQSVVKPRFAGWGRHGCELLVPRCELRRTADRRKRAPDGDLRQRLPSTRHLA